MLDDWCPFGFESMIFKILIGGLEKSVKSVVAVKIYSTKKQFSLKVAILKSTHSPGLTIWGCRYSLILKCNFLYKKTKARGLYFIIISFLFSQKKSQGQRGSWWQTDLFNQIYSIGSNSHICPVNYADDLNFMKTLWLLESKAELIKNFENRECQ